MRYADETVPEVGVVSAFSNGWKQLWPNFLMLILVGLIAIMISAGAGIFNIISEIGGVLIQETEMAVGIGAIMVFVGTTLFIAYGIFVTSPVKYGASYVYLKAARNERIDITDIFEAFRNYLSTIVASVLVGSIVIIGFMLFILPGIYLACKLAFVPYIVVDQKIGPLEAIQESWDMTNGHVLEVFCIGLIGIPLFFVGLIFLLIGVIPAIMWTQIAYASLYHAIDIDDDLDASIYV